MDDDELSLDPDFAHRFSQAVRPDCQLYLISPPQLDAAFADSLAEAFSGGPVAAFQLRLKGYEDHAIARAAEPLQRICADHDVAFIVNDSVSLAKRLGADGVHLGQSDGDPREARGLLGPAVQIGVTCHDSRHLAMEAGEAGADYVAFGAFFPTDTKETFHRPETSILGWWSALFEIPCVAIGGITPANGRLLVEAGADFLAVSNAVWRHADGPAAALKAFEEVLSRARRLGPTIGPILYQLPPRWAFNRARLEDFLALLPGDLTHVFEFREKSWISDEVLALLDARGIAFCVHDMPGSATPRWASGPIAYIRFHGGEGKYWGRYSDEGLAGWTDWIVEQSRIGREIWCYFNNDIDAHAIDDALTLRAMIAQAVR